MVFSGLSAAWRLASWPTNRSPVLVKATTDGVVRLPSLLIITVGLPPSITATTEFVVPKSIPTAFAITIPLMLNLEKVHGLAPDGLKSQPPQTAQRSSIRTTELCKYCFRP